jgi:hypothetical protein
MGGIGTSTCMPATPSVAEVGHAEQQPCQHAYHLVKLFERWIRACSPWTLHRSTCSISGRICRLADKVANSPTPHIIKHQLEHAPLQALGYVCGLTPCRQSMQQAQITYMDTGLSLLSWQTMTAGHWLIVRYSGICYHGQAITGGRSRSAPSHHP